MIDLFLCVFLGFVLGLLLGKWLEMGKSGDFLAKIQAIQDNENNDMRTFKLVGQLYERKKEQKK